MTPPPTEQTLTDADLTHLAAEIAEGRRPTVYLREPVPGLGLAAGASGRVVAVDGTTVTVKPAGVDDQLPFEPVELRMTRQPKPAKAAPAKRTAPSAKIASKAAPSKASPPRTAGARAPRSVAITVYVGADNTASLRVTRNVSKPSGAQDIPIAAVHKAVAGLGDRDAKAAVADVLAAARDAAAGRVADLQAELLAAKKSLAAIERAKRTQP
ncbi:KOW domain-containing RNA-binding protein [Tsukamurella soli]|uniref:Translation initiation factor n=1 Tax=Tsukamurella soli TaxID=644556 RepID=A0ABP8JYA7_9ACTN